MLRVHSRRRGSSILEFVLTLPFTILLLFITLDTGKAVFVKTSLQSAAATAATNGARSGNIGEAGRRSSGCATATSDDLIFQSFCKAAPWGSLGASVSSMTVSMVDADGVKSTKVVCTKEYPYVQVEATVSLDGMLTPGIQRTGFTDIGSVSLFSSVSAISTAYCEVYRE